MSSPQVRSAFRERVQSLLAGFTYVESINRAEPPKDLPAQWYTLDFIGAVDERIALGRPSLFRESGDAIVALFSAQQIGDGPVTDAAQTLRDLMANWRDDTGQLRVQDVGPPLDLDGGDFRGAWYAVTVDVRYTFDRFVS